MKYIVISCFLALSGSPNFVFASHSICNESSIKDDICEAEIVDLHPTQMSVGMIEVREKESRLEHADLGHYKKTHPIPTVIGPKGILYIIDHHHLARAYLDLRVSSGYCQIYANYSNLTDGDFWNQMEQNHWVYPYDQDGKGPFPISSLPVTVSALQNDPYRSLAGAVRDQGAYDKTNTPFSEFKWADFFRTHIQLTSSETSLTEAVIDEAKKLALSPLAKDLPGYKGVR